MISVVLAAKRKHLVALEKLELGQTYWAPDDRVVALVGEAESEGLDVDLEEIRRTGGDKFEVFVVGH